MKFNNMEQSCNKSFVYILYNVKLLTLRLGLLLHYCSNTMPTTGLRSLLLLRPVIHALTLSWEWPTQYLLK